MESQVDRPKIHLRHILLFEFNKGSNVAEAVQTICQVYGEKAIGEEAAQRMFDRFGHGIFDLKDVPYICDDIWWDCFHLSTHRKVGIELALVSDRFDKLVDTHFKSRKWALGNWRIERSQKIGDGTAEIVEWVDRKRIRRPIPEGPLPKGVIGFRHITISYFNSDVLDFLHRIRRLFGPISLEFCANYSLPNCQLFSTYISPLINAPGITKMIFNDTDGSNLSDLRTHISPSFLRNCTNLRKVTSCYELFPQLPPDDSPGASNGQALSKWLHTPRADGHPKMYFEYGSDEKPQWVQQLKTTFLSDTVPVNFIVVQLICVRTDVAVVPYEVENWQTRERLKSWIAHKSEWTKRCISVRSPMDRNAKEWAKWEKEALCGEDGNVLELAMSWHSPPANGTNGGGDNN